MTVNFCGECGAKIKAPDAKACTKCGSDPAKTTKSCTNCGAQKASQGAIMCVSCGEALAKPSTEKDAGIAALISVVCMFVLGAPAVGYFYVGDMRKGLIYLVASWLMWTVVAIAYFLGAMTVVGIVCCLPLLFVPLAFDLLVVYDIYLEAKGEPAKLPSF